MTSSSVSPLARVSRTYQQLLLVVAVVVLLVPPPLSETIERNKS